MRLGRIILLIALIIALGLVVVFFLLRPNLGGTPDVDMAATEQALQRVPVVVLKYDVNRGEEFTEAMLEIRNLPTELVTEGSSFSSFSQVVGETARIDMAAGTFLNRSMLVSGIGGEGDVESTFQGSDHSWLIGEGMVAFPVPINRFSSVAYGLTRGDYVDVIVTMAFVDLDTQFQTITPNQTAGVLTPGSNVVMAEPGPGSLFSGEFGVNNSVAQTATGGALSPQGRAELDALLEQPFYYVPSETQRSRVVSQRVFQNLAVLNVGTFPVYDDEGRRVLIATSTPVPDAAQAEAQAEQVPQMPSVEPPDIITLIMWPQDAVTLNYLLYTGAQVTLALRGAGSVNEASTATDAVTLQYLMDVYRIPLPARLPYGTQPGIEVLAPPVLENDAYQNSGEQQ